MTLSADNRTLPARCKDVRTVQPAHQLWPDADDFGQGGLIVPTTEKTLVGVLADTDIVNLFGEEVPHLFEELNKRYIFNINQMHRYARRRHKLLLLNRFLAV